MINLRAPGLSFKMIYIKVVGCFFSIERIRIRKLRMNGIAAIFLFISVMVTYNGVLGRD